MPTKDVLVLQNGDLKDILKHLMATREASHYQALVTLCLQATIVLVLLLQLGYILHRNSLPTTSDPLVPRRLSVELIRRYHVPPQNTFTPMILFGYVASTISFALAATIYYNLALTPRNFMALTVSYWSYSLTIPSIIVNSIASDKSGFLPYIFSMFGCGVVYPITIYAVWIDGPFNPASSVALFSVGAVDFGGCGVLHVVSGTFVLVSCLVLPTDMSMPGKRLTAISTSLIWIGTMGLLLNRVWISVPASSRLTVSMACIVNSFLAVAGGGFLGLCAKFKRPNGVNDIHNCILASLVGISGVGPLAEPYVACLIGITSSMLYMIISLSSTWPANPITRNSIILHLVCGTWGVLAGGFAGTPLAHENVFKQIDACGLVYTCNGVGPTQWAANVVYLCSVALFSAMVAFFVALLLLHWVQEEVNPSNCEDDYNEDYMELLDDYGTISSKKNYMHSNGHLSRDKSSRLGSSNYASSAPSALLSMSPSYDDLLDKRRDSPSTWI